MKTFYSIPLAISLAFSLGSCQSESHSTEDPLLTHRDTTVQAQKDFFAYANGAWFASHPIPSTERSNGIFRTIGDTIDAQVLRICQKASKADAPRGSFEQKIGDFYASGLDTIQINAQGIKPLQAYFDQINQLNNIQEAMIYMAQLHTLGGGAGFGLYVSQDDKNSTAYAVFLSQGGLGMGNRDYYLNTDAETTKIRKAYQDHLVKMMVLSGLSSSEATASAQAVYQLELALAQHSRKLEDLRDPFKNYNKMSLSELQQRFPKLPWRPMLQAQGVGQVQEVIMGQPEFFAGLQQLAYSQGLAVWKAYLRWDLLNQYASYLSDPIEKQNFAFFATAMNGVKTQKPRWKRVVEQTNSALGELIGQIYVREVLPKGTKEKLMEIGNNIRKVFAQHIQKLDWMGPETKKKALDKLEKMVMKVGYPDRWKDMRSLQIQRSSYCGNVIAAHQWEYQYMIHKLGKPVDRTEWNMYPQTYNAYYNPSNNEIVVPACNIVVPGFEGRMPDDAVLYGIIGGSTFGHEITHGFDDQGCQYDAQGNLNNWWSPEDYQRFKQKTAMIVTQFNAFEVLPGKRVNGEATQGENIADLGGVVVGFEAFKSTPQYQQNQKISGFSPAQRYFLAYAYAWMVQYQKETQLQLLMTDVHAPASCRVNGPLANNPDFFKAFQIPEGSPMRRSKDKLITIW